MRRAAAARRKIKEEEVSSLKTLQDILHNRIIQKKGKMHKTQNRADTTDRVWTEIEALQ